MSNHELVKKINDSIKQTDLKIRWSNAEDAIQSCADNPSTTRLLAMLITGSIYEVTGRIQDRFLSGHSANGFQPATGYAFSDVNGKDYPLRLDDALYLVQCGRVTNVEINPKANYFVGKGFNLNSLRQILINQSEIFTKDEMERYLERESENKNANIQ